MKGAAGTLTGAARRPHIVIITRWRENYAPFASYIDHSRFRVTYVATEVALDSIPAGAAGVRQVPATDDLPAVRTGVHALASRYGPPARIVALKEDDLLVGALLREEWGCPGPRLADLLPFRDKLLMSRKVAARGLPVNAFAPAPDRDAVLAFALRHGWPVIVKPTTSSASQGVVRLDGPADLAAIPPGPEPRLVQVYNPHTVYHVDGLLGREGLVRWRAARYVNTCLDFRHGQVLGSVEEDDPVLCHRIGQATVAFLRALTSGCLVFHLELFVDPGGSCTFLEAGARVGGGETALLWREVHGFDLAWHAFALQCGHQVPAPGIRMDVTQGREVAGHLLVPAPADRPCRITEAISLLGRIPGLYAESIPRTGDIVPAADSYYEHVGGRFRFRAASTADVEKALMATVSAYRVRAEPVTASAGCHAPSRPGRRSPSPAARQ
jgi:biotin carboxylase